MGASRFLRKSEQQVKPDGYGQFLAPLETLMQVALQLGFKAMPTIKHHGSRLQLLTSRDLSAPTAKMSRQNTERSFVFEGADRFP